MIFAAEKLELNGEMNVIHGSGLVLSFWPLSSFAVVHGYVVVILEKDHIVSRVDVNSKIKATADISFKVRSQYFTMDLEIISQNQEFTNIYIIKI